MLTYERTALLKQAVNALFQQTYENLEIIIVNNGGTPENIEYLYEIEKMDNRVKVLHFKENFFDPNDPNMIIEMRINPGLKIAKGDYVFFQNDDDMLAPDYVEKMIKLFKENPECISAAGRPISINADGELNDKKAETIVHNYRPRYMPGYFMALDYIRGGFMLNTYGSIFAFKREVVEKEGGYHQHVEFCHLFGLVPFGLTGYDETAIMYWRHHEMQLNKQMSSKGWIGLGLGPKFLKDWEIESRWKVFGENATKELISYIKDSESDAAANWFAVHFVLLRWKPSFNILKRIWKSFRFWKQLPLELWRRRKDILLHFKPPLKYIFKIFPGIVNISPLLLRLRERVSR